MKRIAAVIGCTLALVAYGVNGSSVQVEHSVEGTSQFHSDRFPSSLDQAEGEVEPVRLAVDERGDAEYSVEHGGGRRLSWWSLALQVRELLEWRRTRAFAPFASTLHFSFGFSHHIVSRIIAVHPCLPHDHNCHDHGSKAKGKVFMLEGRRSFFCARLIVRFRQQHDRLRRHH